MFTSDLYSYTYIIYVPESLLFMSVSGIAFIKINFSGCLQTTHLWLDLWVASTIGNTCHLLSLEISVCLIKMLLF